MAEPIHAFHFPIRLNQRRGGLLEERDYPRYVGQLIRQVLLTAPGERAHRPDFGAGLRRMVFAPNDDATASLIQATIYQNLTKWLGELITVDEVKAAANENRLDVEVTYTLKARGTQEIFNLEVTA
jgi:phage baseplate assembly protein W